MERRKNVRPVAAATMTVLYSPPPPPYWGGRGVGALFILSKRAVQHVLQRKDTKYFVLLLFSIFFLGTESHEKLVVAQRLSRAPPI